MKKLTLPGSKSITNRDLILASLCNWKTILKWVLDSDDTKFMIKALKNLWIWIEEKWEDLMINWWVEKISGFSSCTGSPHSRGWQVNQEIFLWASWTSIRFLTAFSALNEKWKITLKWTERLNERPIWDLIKWLKQLWFKIESNWEFPPVEVFSSKNIWNKARISWKSSSQFFTALLQIWALLPNWLELEVDWDLVSKPYIDITINELNKFWIEIENQNYKKFLVKKQEFKSPWILKIEWDASAFSYISAFSALHWKNIKIENLWKNSKQWDYKFLEILNKTFWLKWESDWETTILKSRDALQCVSTKNIFNFEPMPDISMTFMILAPFLKWKTKITWLQTLNLKECKRIDVMRDELRKFWIEVNSTEEFIEIWFLDLKVVNAGLHSLQNNKIKIETYDDHRIAMSFWIFKSYLDKINSWFEIEILDKDCVDKTYPKFWRNLEYLEK